MEGTIKPLIGINGSPLFPITRASAVYLDKETTVDKKMRELEDMILNNKGLSMLSNVLVENAETGEVLQNIRGVWKSKNIGGNMNIELEQFGIKQGLPVKPYTPTDYKLGFDNLSGIQEALDLAAKKGYSTATLPKGNYNVTFAKTIIIPDNITFDLGGSLLDCMYDSQQKSPYDISTEPAYKWYGIIFALEGTNSHITNGQLKGDRYRRSWVTGETAIEHSYGVSLRKSASFSSITHMEIHGFMGDNINITSGGKAQLGLTTSSLRGSINSTTGEIIPGTETSTTMYSPAFAVDPKYKHFSIGGSGYNRVTLMNYKWVDVFFYDSAGAFLGVLTGRKVQTKIPIPHNAATFRILMYKETELGRNLEIFFNMGSDCNHNVIEFNELYNGHRGGITGGGSYNVIQYNSIRSNGKNGTENFLDGGKTFPDSTRYAINQEDSFGENSIIQYNHIADGFHGILMRSYSTFITGNVFNNVNGIVIYAMDFAHIEKNYNCSITLFGGALEGKVTITGNYLNHVNLVNADYDTVCTGNFITGDVKAGNATFEQNRILCGSANVTQVFSGSARARNNDFKPLKQLAPGVAAKPSLTFLGVGDWEKNTFTGLNLIFNGVGTLNLEKCVFKDCVIITTVIDTKKSYIFKDCDIIDTSLSFRTSGTKDNTIVLIKSSRLTITTASSTNNLVTFSFGNSVENLTYTIEDCELNLSAKALSVFTHLAAYANATIPILVRNTFKNLDPGILYLPMFASENVVSTAYLVDNIFERVVITGATASKFKRYDPRTGGESEPTKGYFSLGKIWKNGLPVAAGFKEWITVTEGVACNTPWAASTVLAVGAEIHANNKVYYVVTAGTTGTSMPNHTTGTAMDGTVSLAYLGPKAAFKTSGVISS